LNGIELHPASRLVRQTGHWYQKADGSSFQLRLAFDDFEFLPEVRVRSDRPGPPVSYNLKSFNYWVLGSLPVQF
jgi:hypothetical protein